MKIATWNINGVRARLDTALAWVKEAAPDILCLQEIKCEDAAFPSEMFEELGYNVATHGQKGFNGVALLSKLPLEDVDSGLAGDGDDSQARFIEAVVSLPGAALRVVSLYLPNGNPVDSDKFPYKLAWMERLDGLCPRPARRRGGLPACRRFQRHRRADRRALSGELDARRALPAGDPRRLAAARQSRPDRRLARLRAGARPLFLLGLSGRRLAEEQRHPHRPHPAVAAGRRPPHRGVDRQAHARLGQALGPRAGGGRTRFRAAPDPRLAIRLGLCYPSPMLRRLVIANCRTGGTRPCRRSPAQNGIACRCLYQGKYFEQGETVCIRVDGRSRLARCDMVLNNSSWTFLPAKNGCPTALMSPLPPRPARPLAASARTDLFSFL